MNRFTQPKTLAAVLLTVGLAGCAGIQTTPSGTAIIDNSYSVGGVGWQGGGTNYIFMKAREKDGMTEVCAAYAPDQLVGGIALRYNRDTLDLVRFESDGDILVHGGGFMNKFNDPRKAAGQTASCVLTTRPWKAAYGEGMVTTTARAVFID